MEDVSELRRLQQIRAEFIDNLSHELRTPLTTVSLLAETLTREAEAAGDSVPARMRDRIGKIEVETGHLVQMVNELLDLSRIESGGALGVLDLLDLGQVATESVERLRLFADRQGVTFVVDAPAADPAGPWRRGAARAGPRQPAAQRGQVQPGRRRGARSRSSRPVPRSSWRSPTTASGSRGRPRRGSSSGSTRSTGRASAARRAGRGLGWRSRATSSSSTAAGSGSNRSRESGSTFSFSLPVAAATGRLTAADAERRSPMDRLHVATLNIRNLADRWFERLPLLLADMAALQPDLLGLQEVVYSMQQDRLIGAAGEGQYGAVRGWAGRPEYGNSLLVREPLVARRTWTGSTSPGTGRRIGRASRCRAARRSSWSSPTSTTSARTRRSATSRPTSLLEWLDEAPAADATILMGDFNADPAEPSPARLRAAGFRSAFEEANGAEPAVTWPSGLQAPAMDTDGEPECLDYIWVRGAVRVDVGAARLRPARPRGPDALPERPPRDRRPARDRVGERVPGRTLRLAHRGDWRAAPENSLAAFLAALAIPACDGLEFDVRASVRRRAGRSATTRRSSASTGDRTGSTR